MLLFQYVFSANVMVKVATRPAENPMGIMAKKLSLGEWPRVVSLSNDGNICRWCRWPGGPQRSPLVIARQTGLPLLSLHRPLLNVGAGRHCDAGAAALLCHEV